MPDINQKVHALNPEDVKKIVATIKRLLTLGKALAKVTPTEMDDKGLEKVETIVLVIEPFLEEEGLLTIIDGIVWLYELLTRKNESRPF